MLPGKMLLCFALAFFSIPLLCSSCPTQCRCFNHKQGDGVKSRSVLCTDPDLTEVPLDVPKDSSRLRIEGTSLRRIQSGSLRLLANLRVLWLSSNALDRIGSGSFRGLVSLEELRLDRNQLGNFPWEVLQDLPRLRLLDLQQNRLVTLPPDVGSYCGNLTYLDLSGNQLTTLPMPLLSAWAMLQPGPDPDTASMILGLHDNPWLCDCRLFELGQLGKFPWPAVALMDSDLRCSKPEILSGVLVSDADMRRCQAPRVHTAVARVRSSVGNNVLLRCGTIGVPEPTLTWARADGKPTDATVQQEVSKEGIIWSILSVPTVTFKDSGKYICRASNLLGIADAEITLVISDTWQIDPMVSRNQGKKGLERAAYQEQPIARYMPSPATPGPMPIIEPLSKQRGPQQVESSSASGGENQPPPSSVEAAATEPKTPVAEILIGPDPSASSLQGNERRVVRSVKVIGDTDHTVSLNWRAPTATNTTAFSVLYAVFGERDMRRINVGAGRNRITIEGLVPRTKYIACVCVKGLVPRKEQCVIFSTDEAASASGTQKLINVVVITVACVIAVPLTLIVCCGAIKRRIQKLLGRRNQDLQDSYVTFETLGPGAKPKNMEGEFLTRLHPDESNRLLSARSSVDSQSTARTEGPPNEYFC
ncbi:hypothetical protein DNTS_004305 [Danionella cerebrum]|uniref:Ig-like domain-containing protein n=1 Tax=Danionella cerebrum TaxID=2873325 RepID=A0A553N1U6_9TELE|nr:hypothetical protein DNTS_004305 [Danionella translucida]